jgi:hypothetical protein
VDDTSGSGTSLRGTEGRSVKSAEQAAYRVYCGLPTRKKMGVLPWRELGNPWSVSLINSGVLSDPDQSAYRPRTPSEAARQQESDRLNEILLARRVRNLLPDECSRRYESAHHESAHAIVVMALGKALRFISIGDDPSGGLCTFAKGSTPLEIATICVAPIVWIEQVYYRQFRHYLPKGATGCDSDLRKATGAVGYDMQWELGKAFRHAREILRDNFDETEALAEKLDRDGVWRP